MTLNLASPWLSHFSPPHLSKLTTTTNTLLSMLLTNNYKNVTYYYSSPKPFKTKASLSESQNEVAHNSSSSSLLDDDLLSRVSNAKDANEALDLIAQNTETNAGLVTTSDSCFIITAALLRNNADLALSVFYAMRSSFDQGDGEKGVLVDRWKWSRPDVSVYTSLVQGLAASLRVSDALKMIDDICRVGVSPGEEVPFGKVVRCPTCLIAVAVAQPQHGIQIVSCAKCRYKYELVSGDIVSIDSEEIRSWDIHFF